jgi:radical SAM family uncharacterized protein
MDFFDAVLIGEGETALVEFGEFYKKHRGNKADFLKEARKIRGFFIPSFAEKNTDNFDASIPRLSPPNSDAETVDLNASIPPLNPRISNAETTTATDGFDASIPRLNPPETAEKANNYATVKKAFVEDFDASLPPLKPLVPNIEIVHDRAVVELYRGCRSGCRFCQAAFFYRPIRERKKDTVKDILFELIKNTGFDEITLASLSTSDYSCLRELMNEIKPELASRHINLSLPSLRLDSFFIEYTDSSRKSSLTFAPEAGTQRLRDVINKNISDENITQSITRAFNGGYRSVKLYFMIGLPTETEEDVLGIVEIVKKIRALYREICHNNSLTVTVSTSVFIPKPLTPFQRERMISTDEAVAKQNLLKNALKAMKGVRYNYHMAESSRLECVMARGGAELSKVIATAYKSGCFFDAWNERFDQKKWEAAFLECGIDFDAYLDEIPAEKKLPWDFIDFSVRPDYLEAERKKAYEGKTTPGCFFECNGCGAECGF